MHLLKIGSRYINLDLCYQISFNDEQRKNFPASQLVAELDVAFPVSMYSDGTEDNENPLEPAGIRVFGEEAEALRIHLDQTATNVTRRYEKHLEQEAREKRTNEWQSRHFNSERSRQIWWHRSLPAR